MSRRMHPSKAVHIGCTDCHGGNFSISVVAGTSPSSLEYIAAKEKAHVQPRNAFFKNRTAVPERALYGMAEGKRGIHQIRKSR